MVNPNDTRFDRVTNIANLPHSNMNGTSDFFSYEGVSDTDNSEMSELSFSSTSYSCCSLCSCSDESNILSDNNLCYDTNAENNNNQCKINANQFYNDKYVSNNGIVNESNYHKLINKLTVLQDSILKTNNVVSPTTITESPMGPIAKKHTTVFKVLKPCCRHILPFYYHHHIYRDHLVKHYMNINSSKLHHYSTCILLKFDKKKCIHAKNNAKLFAKFVRRLRNKHNRHTSHDDIERLPDDSNKSVNTNTNNEQKHYLRAPESHTEKTNYIVAGAPHNSPIPDGRNHNNSLKYNYLIDTQHSTISTNQDQQSSSTQKWTLNYPSIEPYQLAIQRLLSQSRLSKHYVNAEIVSLQNLEFRNGSSGHHYTYFFPSTTNQNDDKLLDEAHHNLTGQHKNNAVCAALLSILSSSPPSSSSSSTSPSSTAPSSPILSTSNLVPFNDDLNNQLDKDVMQKTRLAANDNNRQVVRLKDGDKSGEAIPLPPLNDKLYQEDKRIYPHSTCHPTTSLTNNPNQNSFADNRRYRNDINFLSNDHEMNNIKHDKQKDNSIKRAPRPRKLTWHHRHHHNPHIHAQRDHPHNLQSLGATIHQSTKYSKAHQYQNALNSYNGQNLRDLLATNKQTSLLTDTTNKYCFVDQRTKKQNSSSVAVLDEPFEIYNYIVDCMNNSNNPKNYQHNNDTFYNHGNQNINNKIYLLSKRCQGRSYSE